VKKIIKGGRAEKTGMVFEGAIVAMVSATFGDDMWSARVVGLDRGVKSIQVLLLPPPSSLLPPSHFRSTGSDSNPYSCPPSHTQLHRCARPSP